MESGRPLRFLAATLGGWTVMRVAWLLPEIDTVPDLIHAVAPPLAAATLPPKRMVAQPTRLGARRLAATQPVSVRGTAAPVSRGRTASAPRPTGAATLAPQILPSIIQPTAPVPPPLRPAPLPKAGESRWSASAWVLARGGAAGTLTGGRLGGSQAGLRLTYALDSSRRVALAARVATPLEGAGREAAIGVEWRPFDLPVRLIAEQRVSLDGGRGGPTLMLVGGIGPTPVGGGFRLESYAQAGAVARGEVEGFADGAARITRGLARLGRTQLDIGAGAWGAAQRDAGRLDIGPTLGVAVPVGARAIRLTLDWRQRIAGDARPGSGPALSLGSDF